MLTCYYCNYYDLLQINTGFYYNVVMYYYMLLFFLLYCYNYAVTVSFATDKLVCYYNDITMLLLSSVVTITQIHWGC